MPNVVGQVPITALTHRVAWVGPYAMTVPRALPSPEVEQARLLADQQRAKMISWEEDDFPPPAPDSE